MAGSWFRRGVDRDWVDSVNGFWSVLLLAGCALGAFAVRFVQPINCMDLHQKEYSEGLCLTSEDNLYIEGMNPENHKLVSYHLWVPLILLIQALCFKIPGSIWNASRGVFSLNMDETVASLEKVQQAKEEVRRSTLRDTAVVYSTLLGSNKIISGVFYIIVKGLSLANLVGQFLFLTVYFSPVLTFKPRPPESFTSVNPFLTRSVRCRYTLRRLQNTQTMEVECRLQINEIYEKMFAFLWFWVLFLTVLTFINLLVWLAYLLLPFFRNNRISVHIAAFTGCPTNDPALARFISSFLGLDGVLMLTMISRNSSEMVAAGFAHSLFQVFREQDQTSCVQRGPYGQGPTLTGEMPLPSSHGATSSVMTSGSNLQSEGIPMTTLGPYNVTCPKKPLLQENGEN
ncbi:innexin-11-like [Haliotis rubra]|uniref:innexin-11-like n=1 Tax=Haliotis rubra TaxID=36100 RepID=UPI001EE5CEC8|nr:innexin-11-like [Haliotis rubra]